MGLTSVKRVEGEVKEKGERETVKARSLAGIDPYLRARSCSSAGLQDRALFGSGRLRMLPRYSCTSAFSATPPSSTASALVSPLSCGFLPASRERQLDTSLDITGSLGPPGRLIRSSRSTPISSATNCYVLERMRVVIVSWGYRMSGQRPWILQTRPRIVYSPNGTCPSAHSASHSSSRSASSIARISSRSPSAKS